MRFRSVLGLSLLLGSLPITWTPAKAAEPFIVGVCTHFSQGKGHVQMNLDMIKAAGMTAIRDESGWSGVERVKGQLRMPDHVDEYVRAAAAKGIDVMMILDYANRHYDDGDRPRSPEAIEGFCRYGEFLARHFGKDIPLYEIWNEWDISIGMPEPYRKGGSPEDYVKLLKAVYPRIKEANPDAVVVAGGCTSGGVNNGWFQKVIELGALDHCDAVSIHSYNYSDKFPNRSPETCSKWMAGVQEMLRKNNDGKDVPFYVTEMGWPNQVDKRGTEPQLSASYLARLYLLARTAPSFRGLWWYDFQDDGWNSEENENNFGIVRPDLTPKPHYHVMADISNLIATGQYAGQVKTEDENLQVLRFRHNGGDVWAIWSADDQQRQVILEAMNPPAKVSVQQLGCDAVQMPWGFRNWAGGDRQFHPDQFSVVVDHRPVLITANMRGVSILRIEERSRSADYGHRR